MKHAAPLLLALLATACGVAPERAERTAAIGAVAPNGLQRQILLTVKQPAAVTSGLTGAPAQRYLQRRYGPAPGVERVLARLVREHGVRRIDGWPIQSLDVYCEVLEVPAERDVDATVAALAADPHVDLVQRMNTFMTQSARYDDPYFDLQTAAVELDIEPAHRVATGRGVSIAIIDSGVDATHADLRGRVQFSRNLVGAHPRGRDGEVHGTAVAGIIASAANNNEGIIGVAPDVSIAALRACWSVTVDSVAAECSTFSLALALQTALDLGPNVINMSLAGPADTLLSRLLDVAIERGIVVVTATPRTNESATSFPSSHPQVLSAHSSHTPVHADSPFVLPAPADEVITTTPGNRYAFLSGNSLAAAHTSGVVALLKQRDPELDAERIAAILTATTLHSPRSTSINACRALARLDATASCSPTAADAR